MEMSDYNQQEGGERLPGCHKVGVEDSATLRYVVAKNAESVKGARSVKNNLIAK